MHGQTNIKFSRDKLRTNFRPKEYFSVMVLETNKNEEKFHIRYGVLTNPKLFFPPKCTKNPCLCRRHHRLTFLCNLYV